MEKEVKEVKKDTPQDTPYKDFYFTTYELIKSGLNPKAISERLNLSKQRVNYYISSLKRNNLIKKMGYGTWEITNEFKQTSKKTSKNLPKKTLRVTATKSMNFPENTIRGHAFAFKLKLPNLKNWERREEYLASNNIQYKKLNIFGGAEQISFRGRKIQITNKSVIVYEKASYFDDSAKETENYAVYDFLELVKGLELMFKASFKINGKYAFKVIRKHYAMIKNSLAQQYNREHKKLMVYNDAGTLWFIIDDSYNLNEAEVIKTAFNSITQEETTNRVKNFFNGIPKYEGFTPEFIVNSIGELVKDRADYSQNIASHVQAIKDLGEGIREFNKLIKDIKKR